MSAIVGQDWRPKTFRELFIQWQAVLLESWHHTSSIRASFISDKKIKYEDLHPYLEASSQSKVIIESRRVFPEVELDEIKELGSG